MSSPESPESQFPSKDNELGAIWAINRFVNREFKTALQPEAFKGFIKSIHALERINGPRGQFFLQFFVEEGEDFENLADDELRWVGILFSYTVSEKKVINLGMQDIIYQHQRQDLLDMEGHGDLPHLVVAWSDINWHSYEV